MKQYFLILACIFFCTLQGSNPTAFDTSFNNIGYVEQSLGATQAAGQNSVLMQADGKTISIGVTSDTTHTGYNAIVIIRYLSDGTIDTSYGTEGITYTSFDYNTYAYAAAIQADGKVVVVGTTSGTISSTFYNSVLFVARFTTAGALDNTFNTVGYAIAQVETNYNAATGVAINSATGDIFVSGYSIKNSPSYREIFIYSYNSNGTLNTGTFGSNGYIIVSPPSGYLQTTGTSPAVQDDGKIIVAGSVCASSSLSGSNLQLALFRYNSDGSVDTTFGNSNGYVIFNEYANYPYSSGQGIALQPNGSIIVSGSAITTSGNQQIMTARYLTDGTIDTSFNGTGYNVTTIPNSSLSIGIKPLLEPSGKIIAGGYATFSGSINNILLVRYNQDGTLDTSLNSNGYMLSDINGESTTLRSNTIQTDGKLVIVAQTTADNNDSMITIRYLGGNLLEGSTSAISAYGTNANLFQEFLYIDFYATIITDPTAQAVTILAINTILTDYATAYVNQPDFNYLLYLYLLEEQFIEAKADLLVSYSESTTEINQFFMYLNDRITKLSNQS